VNKAGSGAVAEVGRGQIEEVDDEQQQGQPEVRAYPEVDEAEEEEVVRDEVGTDMGGGGDVNGVRGVEVVAVADLEDEKDDPINARNDRIHRERRMMHVILSPYGPARLVALVRLVEGVVDARDDEKKP